jgi:hypothetical protein
MGKGIMVVRGTVVTGGNAGEGQGTDCAVCGRGWRRFHLRCGGGAAMRGIQAGQL